MSVIMDDGYKIITGAMDAEDIVALRECYKAIIYEILEREDVTHASLFQFQRDTNTLQDLHNLVIACGNVAPSVISSSMSAFMQTLRFKSVLSSNKLQSAIREHIWPSVQKDHLVSSDENFRVDLPSSFKKEDEKYSLGWHQESAYFDKNVSHENGIVLWIPLFDVNQEGGALKVACGSHKSGKVSHHYEYKDKQNKKNLRATIPPDLIAEYKDQVKTVEVSAGDIVAFHFNLFHSGGVNLDPNYARLTIQSRLSFFSDDGFRF
jgi:hypothetical protein